MILEITTEKNQCVCVSFDICEDISIRFPENDPDLA